MARVTIDPGDLHAVADGLGRRAARVVVAPPGPGAGYWAGAPSALWHGNAVWLAYRLRRPVDSGRGYANVVARSGDGYRFETVAEVTSDQFDSASLERPALVVAPDGTWRLYVSCSTEGSKHWWVEMLGAASPERFGRGRGTMVLPGDLSTAWKDPVVVAPGTSAADASRRWQMWACRHDIAVPDQADRMESWYFTSSDGTRWAPRGPALRPTLGSWDERGVRITAVVGAPGPGDARPDRWLAFYDGRASAAENWAERTGVAVSTSSLPDHFEAVSPGPLVSSPSVRYLSPVELPDGGWMVYYEASRTDGAHDLRVEYVPRPASTATADR